MHPKIYNVLIFQRTADTEEHLMYLILNHLFYFHREPCDRGFFYHVVH